MNYSNIKEIDTANGLGVRVSIFVSGCTLRCRGCFSTEAWDFNHGDKYTQETEDRLVALLSRPYIRGLSILGGNPTEPENEPDLIRLCERVRRELPDKDIWMWTGHTMEELVERDDKLYPLCDTIIEGRFVEGLKDLSLLWRGSSNQRMFVRRDGKFVQFRPEDGN